MSRNFYATIVPTLLAAQASKTDSCSSNETNSPPTDRMNTTADKMNTSSPFREVTNTETSFTYYGKVGATWEQMDAYLENLWGKNGKDTHWKWRGFGECGTDKFQVVVLRQQCSKYICECETCEDCGILECDLEENDDGDKVCYECMNKCDDDESEDEDDVKCYWCNARGCDKKNENGVWIHTDCE